MIHPNSFDPNELMMLLASEDQANYYMNSTSNAYQNNTSGSNLSGFVPGMYGMMPILMHSLKAIANATSLNEMAKEVGFLLLSLFFANSLFSASIGFYAMTSFFPFLKRKLIDFYNYLFPTEFATMSIDQQSDVYMFLNNWLYRKAKFVHVPNELQADLKELDNDDLGDMVQELIFYPVENEEREFVYEGHSIYVSDGKADSNKPSNNRESAAEQLEALFTKSKRIRMRIKGEENLPILKKILKEAQELYSKSAEDKTLIYYFKESWNQWIRLSQHESRTIESVYLEKDMKKDLMKDIDRFFDSATLYRKNGTPWRRGYLLHGLPGTGKTSLVSAIAAKYDLNLAIMNIADIRNSSFVSGINSVPPRTILLIEDVDALFESDDNDRSSRSSRNQVNFSTFLNGIDGVATPEGRITIMTTNHIEKLDSALIRPGRIDRKFEFFHATIDQKRQMCQAFFEQKDQFLNVLLEGLTTAKATTAQVQCVLQYYQNKEEHELEHVTPEDVNTYFQVISKNYSTKKSSNDDDDNESDEIDCNIILYKPSNDVSNVDQLGRGKCIQFKADPKDSFDVFHSYLSKYFHVKDKPAFTLIDKEGGFEITSLSMIKEKGHYLVELE